MAKPTTPKSTARGTPAPSARAAAKPARAGIGDIMAGVSLTPTAAPAGLPPGAPARDGEPVAAGRDAHAARDLRHPVASGVAFERVENIYRMDPRKVVLEGPYIRQFLEDADFHRLTSAVARARDIGPHNGVRVVGPPTNQRRVLVYGMRRWRAALAVGLDKVPVRDYGPISEDKAVELQMLENEIRADPHPVDTATGFYLLAQQPDWSQKRIAEVFDKNKGYVSEMVRVGEAIARLRESDRQPLYTSSRVTVRAFQSIAQVKSVEARKDALLGLLQDSPPQEEAGPPPEPAQPDRTAPPAPTPGAAQASRRKLVDVAVFHTRALRNGRAFRVRWTDDDLRRDGTQIAEEFKARFLEEYQLLLHRTAVLHGGVAGQGDTVPPRIAALVASAAQDAARVDARIGAVAGSSHGPTGSSAPAAGDGREAAP
jgi:ParB-like chromosome segregation protein Spo0J